MLRFLDTLHARVRTSPLIYRLVIGTRVLLCAAFLPTGIVKLLGRPFTIMDPRTPVGLFFHALHQTGVYWRFIGAAQIVAALLLLIPSLAHLGAMMFLPILVNIVVITVTMEFKGTPAVTVLMLLANLLLLAWDWHRWRSLLTTMPPSVPAPEPLPLSTLERLGFTAGAICGVTFFLGTRSLVPKFLMMPSLAGAALAMLLVVILGVRHLIPSGS
ncbi:MAG TPA: hypothetical protein VM733_02485 [Thermoanaerobaculia bacterium]|nr:hypothetical protein [Thermoanaerobaculia bacterium]